MAREEGRLWDVRSGTLQWSEPWPLLQAAAYMQSKKEKPRCALRSSGGFVTSLSPSLGERLNA